MGSDLLSTLISVIQQYKYHTSLAQNFVSINLVHETLRQPLSTFVSSIRVSYPRKGHVQSLPCSSSHASLPATQEGT